MSLTKKSEKKQYSFSENVDFKTTPLDEVRIEYMRKKIQLNWASSIVNSSTDNLHQYVLDLETHIKILESKQTEQFLEVKKSIKLCNVLITTSFVMFLTFSLFSVLTNSLTLLVVTYINAGVFGVVYLYKVKKRSSINH